MIVTYDANGFYGHPDHIQAHRVAWRAHELTGRAAKFYATAMPRSALAAAVELPADSWFVRNTDLSVSVPDDQVTTEIDATRYLPAKLAAMKRARDPDHGGRRVTSHSPTRSAAGRSASSTTRCWPGRRRRGPRPAGHRYERDLFARCNR